MKSVDVKSSTHINFVQKIMKANVRWTYLIEDLNRKKLLQCFIKNKLLKFGVEKLIKTKGDKLYVKWNCYDN